RLMHRSLALSKSPPASSKILLHSIIPRPVMSRNSLTAWAGVVAISNESPFPLKRGLLAETSSLMIRLLPSKLGRNTGVDDAKFGTDTATFRELCLRSKTHADGDRSTLMLPSVWTGLADRHAVFFFRSGSRRGCCRFFRER